MEAGKPPLTIGDQEMHETPGKGVPAAIFKAAQVNFSLGKDALNGFCQTT